MLDPVALHVCDSARSRRPLFPRTARTLTRVAMLVLLAGTASAAQPGAAPSRAAPPGAPSPQGAASTADLHALGVLLSGQLGSFGLSESEFRAVAAGFADGYHHPEMATEARTHVPQLQGLERTRAQQASQREDRAGQRYLARIAAMPRAHKTASGLVYVPIAQGSGAAPTATDQVTVQYTGKLIDGSVFDSSAAHGGSATFTLGRVIPCWTEGLQLMKVGGSARLICPAALAYGDHGAGGVIKPGATLDFEVKLMAVHPAPPPGNFASPLGAPPTGAPRAATPH